MGDSNAEHQSPNISQARRKADNQHGENDEEAEMLLSMIDSHLDEEPHDKADQGCFDQRKQPCAFTPIKSKALVDAPTKLDHGVADGVLFTVPKHVDAHHGCKPIAELPKHHAEHHRVSEQGFVERNSTGWSAHCSASSSHCLMPI